MKNPHVAAQQLEEAIAAANGLLGDFKRAAGQLRAELAAQRREMERLQEHLDALRERVTEEAKAYARERIKLSVDGIFKEIQGEYVDDLANTPVALVLRSRKGGKT